MEILVAPGAIGANPMAPDPELIARMIAALCTLAVGATVVALVGWIIHL